MNVSNMNMPHRSVMWYVFGIILVIMGLMLLSAPIIATFATILAIGSLLIAAGILHLIIAFFDRRSDHLWLHLVIAMFTLLVGILMVFNLGVTALALTLLLGLYFLGSGVFRIIGALTARFNGWGWYVFSGVISFLLGILILAHWPSASLWVIGLFVGIDLLFAGISLFMIALVSKRATIFGQ